MKKFHAMLAFMLLLSFINISVQSESGIVAGPYLQNLTENSVTIMWITEEKTEKNVVYWGEELENMVEENEKGRIHAVTIDLLEENTTYLYEVESDGARSKTYSFHTLPTEGKINFIVYGDSRGVWDGWRNASRVAKAMEGKANVVITTGDMVRNGGNEGEWLDFIEISKFMHNSSLYPCVGNHDLPYSIFQKYFPLPGNEGWYSFDYGCAHFTIMDVCSPLNIPKILWLIHDLRSDASWKFVIFHYPPYSSGEHGSTEILRLLTPFFDIMSVDMVFNGHDHDYEHVEAGGTTFIVTGGGGAPLYDVGSSPWTIFSASSYHYCLVEATSRHLHFSAITPDGEVLEEFEMEK
ncbi:MAG: metallophosphoesterase family protein [Thermoplasmata archaeon]|nr:metallophosphoesterase family protein [Thermoplasmata archaeon]